MSNQKTLNFSLGPVQGFIATARKTRDFGIGSFILSSLAGQAMAVILEEGGGLILPAVAKNKNDIQDPLLQVIWDRRQGKEIKYKNYQSITATLPNRFRAKVPADFDPELCKQAIEEKWSQIAEIIWDRYLNKAAALGKSTYEIWQRQVNNFWEINWIIGDNLDALDLRKNWRNHLPPFEPGDKCTLFGTFQELSGYLRIREKEKQDQFWETLRQQKQPGVLYDLEKNERLCAIALIKRLFPYIADKIIYKVPTNYPSTPYLAAINWIANTIKNKPHEARDYAIMASSLPGAQGRENPDLFSAITDELNNHPQARMFAALDGNCFFKAALENPNLWDEPLNSASDTAELRGEMTKKLEKLTESSPFYALLLMDGDSLGALLQTYGDKMEDVSRALNLFSSRVPLYTKKGNGITVFAGGDDVLALLPLENALHTATELCSLYQETFESNKINQATISGSIVYAHFTTPLTGVYHEAQNLLTNVAKEKTGRDSLAVAVLKSGGKVLSWSAPWKTVNDKFIPFLKGFQKNLPGSEQKLKEFSNSFFYNIQDRLGLFPDGNFSLSGFTIEDLTALLTAEYIKSRGQDIDRQKAQTTMEQLVKLCQPHWRDKCLC